MQDTEICLLLWRGCLGKTSTIEPLKKVPSGGFLSLLGLVSHSVEGSCLTKASKHISCLLLDLSTQHDVIEVTDQCNVLRDDLKVQITLDYIMREGREVNRALGQNCK